jgi:hypothetical protein
VQSVVGVPLKVCRSVDEFERHDKSLVESSSRSESCFSFIFFCDSKKVVCVSYIECDVVLGLRELIERFANEWERVTVLDDALVQTSVVDTQSKRAILFLDEEYRSSCERR